MKTTKRILTTLLAVIMLFGVVVIAAEAANLSTTKTNYGYMITTDAKISKAASTVKVYGNYDYLNFYINSNYNNMYFFYEIYSDKEMTKMVAGDYTYCKSSGAYSWSPKIKLKGVLNSGTYYGATYAAKIDGSGNAKISEPSLQQFKLVVNRKPEFKQQMVILKSVTTTVNGPVVKWSKLSNDVSKYVIYRRNLTGTKWTKAGTVKGSTLSFTDKSVKDKNGKFVYTVRALNKSGVGTRYLYNGLTCLFARAPKISSVSTVSDNRVKVKWNNTSNSAYYKVYRSENGGKWKTINSKFKGTTYYDTTAENGKNYKYTVKAVIRTSYGNAVSAYHNVNKTVDFLNAPKLNPVTVVENGLNITWEKVEGAENYTVFRKTLEKGAKWVNLGEVSADVAEYVDTTANEESAFSYTIRADGKTSKGSYSNKGVEYFTLEQPEFTVALDNNLIELKWSKVPFATSYKILKKSGDGVWEYYNETKNNEYVVYLDNYFNSSFTIQAVRGNVVSEYKEDVEPIIYYPPINPRFTIYNDYIQIDWYRWDTEKCNIYKKLETEADSEYKLVYSGTDNSLKDSEVEYDVGYTYQVKGVWDGVEQDSNIRTKSITKYSPDKYIKSFKPYIRRVDTSVYGTKSYDDSSVKYFFDRRKLNTSKKMEESIYCYYNDSWDKVNVNNQYFEGEDDGNYERNIAYVVHDSNGSTPIDGLVRCVGRDDVCSIPQVEITPLSTDGIKVMWDPVPNAVKYRIVVKNNGKEFYKKTITADDSKRYSTEIENIVYKKNGFAKADIRVLAISKSGNEALKYIKGYFLFKTPALKKAVSKDNGIYVMWDAYDTGTWYKYVVFRKAEGESSWTKVDERHHSEHENLTINGTTYNDVFYYVDRNVTKGKKYTYTVRIYKTETKEYVSGYDTKGISAVAK